MNLCAWGGYILELRAPSDPKVAGWGSVECAVAVRVSLAVPAAPCCRITEHGRLTDRRMCQHATVLCLLLLSVSWSTGIPWTWRSCWWCRCCRSSCKINAELWLIFRIHLQLTKEFCEIYEILFKFCNLNLIYSISVQKFMKTSFKCNNVNLILQWYSM